ncbi:DUF6907 domain-containing protein [Streptomyces sp. NPDC057235]|uniref:DUF6907 domain-containing protein n=1 Tax=Streptomyces sp. NPDC057235 TaxID=3346058 RepID=UPI0036351EAD
MSARKLRLPEYMTGHPDHLRRELGVSLLDVDGAVTTLAYRLAARAERGQILAEGEGSLRASRSLAAGRVLVRVTVEVDNPRAPFWEMPADGGDRTVTVATGDHGDVVVPEPSWCAGLHAPEGFRADVEHQSEGAPAVLRTVCHGLVPVLPASLAQRPFSAVDRRMYAVLDTGGDFHELDAPALDDAAEELSVHAMRLRSLARQLREVVR